MTLNEYLKQNPNSSVETMENLFSVGCVIDTVSGNTFPMMADSSIGFDESTNEWIWILMMILMNGITH